ncbi:MAG: hypothetical protein ABH852_04950 [Methanobacteriota archaeon]
MKPDSDSGSRSVNVLGVVAGIFMIALPFLGPWWIAVVGTGAIEIALSPFDMSVSVLGQPIQSELISLFLLAARIAMIIAGVFMIFGSVSPKSWWSKRLVRFGVMKPFWAVVGIVVFAVAGAFIINNVLPNFLSNMVGGTGASIQLEVPYLMGTANSVIQIGSQATVTAPVNVSLATPFWLAVVAAVLGIAARISHRKYTKKVESK